MNEYGRDEIIYDEGFYHPHTIGDDQGSSDDLPPDEQPPAGQGKDPSADAGRGLPSVLTLRLILCILLALTLFILKLTGASLWDGFARWYHAEMSRTLISQSDFQGTQLNSLFAEIGASADEAAPVR